MSKNDRGTVFKVVTAITIPVSLAFIFLAVWSHGSQHGAAVSQNNRNTTHYAKEAEQHIEKTCLNREPAAMAECIRQIVEATNENHRAEDDLLAQTEMSIWALGVLIVSGFTFMLTAIGVWFIYQTAEFSRATLTQAKEATKAANKTVDVTREMGQAQTRAYLAFDGGHIDFNDGGTFHCSINNLGSTPAYDVAVSIKCAYSAAETDLQDIKWGEPKELSERPCDPNQQITYNYSGDKISKTEISGLPAKDIWFYGSIIIKYRDIFMKEKEKEFECEYIVTRENLFAKPPKDMEGKAPVGVYRTIQTK